MEAETLAVNVETAAKMAGVSRATLFRLVLSGDLPSVKIGTRRLIVVERLREWLDAQTAEAR